MQQHTVHRLHNGVTEVSVWHTLKYHQINKFNQMNVIMYISFDLSV